MGCGGATYRTVKGRGEQDLDMDVVVLTDNTLAGPHQVALRLRGLDLEHDRNAALVDQLEVGLGAVTLHGPETQVRNRVQRDHFSPVLGLLLLRRCSKRCFIRLHRHIL